MKVSKRQLKKIVREKLLSEFWGKDKEALVKKKAAVVAATDLGPQKITASWSDSGLTMKLEVNGRPVIRLSSQSDARNLIELLEELLSGPMRTTG